MIKNMKKVILFLITCVVMSFSVSYSQDKALVFSVPQAENQWVSGYAGGMGLKFPFLGNTFRLGFNYSKPIDSVDATKLYSIVWINTQYKNEYTTCYWGGSYTGGDVDGAFDLLVGAEFEVLKNVSVAGEYKFVSYNLETSGYELGSPNVGLLLNIYF